MNSDNIQLPSYSSDALSALDIFYEGFNAVNFYVEDIDQENLYEIVLRKILPDLSFVRVFPLGGKCAVINHALSENHNTTTPAIYLLDKDFDDLLNKEVDVPMVFYWDRYCVENYFVEENSIVEIVLESYPKKKRVDVISSLQLENKIPELFESLVPIFQLFFGVQCFGLGIENTGLPIERFCKSAERWLIDNDKIEQYASEIKMIAEDRQCTEMIDPLANQRIVSIKNMDRNKVISGKHLCVLIFHYIKSMFKLGSITFDSFIFRLAKNSSMVGMNKVATDIRSALGLSVTTI